MEDVLFRLAVTAILLGPMAISDWRERMVNSETLYIALGIGTCFFLYDVFTGAFFGYSFEAYLGMLLTVIVCGVMCVSIRHITASWADALFILAFAMIIPPVSGVHIAIPAVLAGLVFGVVFFVASSLCRNISDMIRKKEFSRDMLLTHVKRKGEKFTMAGRREKVFGSVRDDMIYDRDGHALFESEESSGIMVSSVVPLCTMLFAGLFAVMGMLYFTDVDLLGIVKSFYGVGQMPSISWSPGFGP